jgi:2-polyprenyl-6-methoxyphenol hydroxylase-like FAD-dependent oxidoreductase
MVDGGFGLNTGLEDAVNLACKLAAVLRSEGIRGSLGRVAENRWL